MQEIPENLFGKISFTLDSKTKQMVKEWVAKDNGNTETTARWMARSLKIAGIKECRKLVEEAMQD